MNRIEIIQNELSITEYNVANLGDILVENCNKIAEIERIVERTTEQIEENEKKAKRIQSDVENFSKVKTFKKKKSIEEIQDIVKDLSLSQVDQAKINNYILIYQQCIGMLIKRLSQFSAISVASNDAVVESIKDILKEKANGNMSAYLQSELNDLLINIQAKQSLRKDLINEKNKRKDLEKRVERLENEHVRNEYTNKNPGDDSDKQLVDEIRRKLDQCNHECEYDVLLDELLDMGKDNFYADEFLGAIYAYGMYGVEENDEIAKEFFLQASDGIGSPYAQWELAWYYAQEGKDKEYVKYQNMSAEGGCSLAQHDLGLCYYYGEDGCYEEDEEEAYYWLDKAANQGDVLAKVLRARLVYMGYGDVELDRENGARLYFEDDLLKDNNFLEACDFYNVGECYYYGYYVEEDNKEAINWFNLAKEKDYDWAYLKLAECYFGGGMDGSVCDYDKAYDMGIIALDRGLTRVASVMGFICIEKNKYVEAIKYLKKYLEEYDDSFVEGKIAYCYDMLEDDIKAFVWYEKAAENGEVYEMYCLGEKYYFGIGVEQDYDEAFYWVSEAVENAENDEGWILDAMGLLGEMYRRGAGCEVDFENAKSLLIEAVQSDDNRTSIYAALNLGDMYYDLGKIDQAKYWLNKAANKGSERAVEILVEYGLE